MERTVHAVSRADHYMPYTYTARGNEELEAQMNDISVGKPPHRGVWRRRRFRKVLMLDAYLSNRIRYRTISLKKITEKK